MEAQRRAFIFSGTFSPPSSPVGVVHTTTLISSALLAFVGLAASACVWSPANQSEQRRSQSVPINGYAQTPGATIVVKAFNHDTGVDDTITTVIASSDEMFAEPHLYFWDAGWRVFADKYWAPTAWGCSSSGMLRLRVYDGTTRLKTFNEGQRDCVLDEISDGSHPVAAADECGYADQIVIFAPPAC